MNKTCERDSDVSGGFYAIVFLIVAFLFIILIANSREQTKIEQAKLRTATVVAPASFCNSSYDEGRGVFTCRVNAVVDNQEYTFYYKEVTAVYEKAIRLQGIESVLEGADFIVDYDPNNLNNFVARPAGFNSIFEVE